MEATFTFFTTLFVFLLIKFCEVPNRKHGVICGLTGGIAALSKQTGIALPAFVLSYIWLYKRNVFRHSKGHLFILFVTFILVASPYYIRSQIEFGQIVGQFPELEQRLSYFQQNTNENTIITFDRKIRVEKTDYMLETRDPPLSKLPNMFIRTYYEAWGIIQGKIERVYTVEGLIPFHLIPIFIGGFTGITLILSFLTLKGIVAIRRDKRFGSLLLWTVEWCLAFLLFSVIIAYQGVSLATWGYRKPLFPITPTLAIFLGLGMDAFIYSKPKNLQRKLIPAISLLICFLVVTSGFIVIRNSYNKIMGGAEWIRKNTHSVTVILTANPSDIAYYAGRFTVDIKLLRAESIFPETFEKYGIGYVHLAASFKGVEEDAERMKRVIDLIRDGYLIKVYKDEYFNIWKVNMNKSVGT